jgi:hypothetical protein
MARAEHINSNTRCFAFQELTKLPGRERLDFGATGNTALEGWVKTGGELPFRWG